MEVYYLCVNKAGLSMFDEPKDLQCEVLVIMKEECIDASPRYCDFLTILVFEAAV